MDGKISDPESPLVENNEIYPYGTTEQYPAMRDSMLNIQHDSAHYYMECSNRGSCDRSTGECSCADGYDGVACQRASCPGFPASCSGHGVCRSIEDIAKLDHGNLYKLWDRRSTMGCICDSGYGAADCSQKLCKWGVDPLYMDDVTTIKYSTFNFAVVHTDLASLQTDVSTVHFSDGLQPPGVGLWSIRFYDIHGEDWLTSPLKAGASCKDVVTALESIPNKVIPSGSVFCSVLGPGDTTVSGDFTEDSLFDGPDSQNRTTGLSSHKRKIKYRAAFWDYYINGLTENVQLSAFQTFDPDSNPPGFPSSYDSSPSIPYMGLIYKIKFFGNPGKLKQPEIEIYLDGSRPTLQVSQQQDPGVVSESVVTKVWTDGQQGENLDYFADHCNNVTVTISELYDKVCTYDTDYKTGQVTAGATPCATTTDASRKFNYLSGLTVDEVNRLKVCLGGSDFDDFNNIEVYNWDAGSAAYPHLVKLVYSHSVHSEGGYYAALYYVPPLLDDNDEVREGSGIFKLLNPFKSEDVNGGANDEFDIYTTHGVLSRTTGYIYDNSREASKSEAFFGFASNEIYLTSRHYVDNNYEPLYYSGSVACEFKDLNSINDTVLPHCLNKTDTFLLLNFDKPALNPPHLNIYTAERLYTRPMRWSNTDFQQILATKFEEKDNMLNDGSTLMTHVIVTDISTNWASAPLGMVKGAQPATTFDASKHPEFEVYKFTPNVKSTYEYVAECSNRGHCDYFSGLCTCFPGYTSDSCAIQNSLAL